MSNRSSCMYKLTDVAGENRRESSDSVYSIIFTLFFCVNKLQTKPDISLLQRSKPCWGFCNICSLRVTFWSLWDRFQVHHPNIWGPSQAGCTCSGGVIPTAFTHASEPALPTCEILTQTAVLHLKSENVTQKVYVYSNAFKTL